MLQTVDAIFVGYSPDHKAYRCYVPDLQDIVISNNVKFQDDYFPYRKKRDMDKVQIRQKFCQIFMPVQLLVGLIFH